MAVRKLLLCLLALAFAPAAMAAGVVAKKDGVKVLGEPKKGATVLMTLNKDQPVESIERQGMYWKVKTSSGAEGYVSVLKVKKQADAGGGLSQAIQAVAHEGRDSDDVENTRARSAVMGVRGLDESDETSFAGNAKPNMRLVYAMEDRRVTTKRLNALEAAINAEVEAVARKRGMAP